MRVKGLWGVAVQFLVVLVLLGWSAAAEAATVSGTVTNGTAITGSRVYLSVASQFGGNAVYGVSIPAPAPSSSATYAIRGVPDGSYVVNAFLDARSPTSATRHSNDPFGGSQQFAVNGGDVSSVDITLNAVQNPVALQTPTIGGVVPGPGSAMITWDTPTNNNGLELAYSYNVYWHTDNTVSPTNFTGKKSDIPARNDGMFIQTMLNDTTPLPDGTTLYYMVEAQRGQSGQPGYEVTQSAVSDAVTIGAIPTSHPSSFTVSGTITIDNGITVTGPLLIAVYTEAGGIYLAKISNPGLSNNFTVTGVPNGSYQVFSLIDQNNDGLIWAGDYMVGDRNAPSIAVNGADLSGITSNIPKRDVDASVATSHTMYANDQEFYGLEFSVNQAFRLPVNVAIQDGQDVAGPVDLAVSEWGDIAYWVSNVLRPTPGTQYALDIGYDSGSPASVLVAVTAVLDDFPEPVSPQGNVTFNATPVFSWTAPVTSPAGGYSYSLNVSGNNFWWYPERLPATQTSATFNFDGQASQNALTDNTGYDWEIAVTDQNGNQARKGASFFSGGSISGTVNGSDTSAGVAGIFVQVYDGSGNWQYNSVTEADGSFIIGGLQSGTYRVCFQPGQTSYIAQCYDNKAFDPSQATNITVNSPSDTLLNPIVLSRDTTPPTSSASPTGGGFAETVSVTLFASEPATIYYTTSGSDPNLSSPSLSVISPGGAGGSLSITPPAILKFYAVDQAGNTEATIHVESYTLGIPTTTSLLANLNPSTYGAGVTFTANVSSASATGSVQFYADGVPIGTPVPLSGGSASMTVSSLAAGTRSITAVYGGGGGYAASSSNQLSQTVNPAPLTVTANTQTKVYGLNDPSLSYNYNGIVNNDPPSIFSGALARAVGESVGTYAISQGSLSAGSNYTISFTGANLTITPATLSITADTLTKVYGAADPLLTYSTSGLANNDTTAVITGTLARQPGENAGTYAIQQNGLSVGSNYTLNFTGANLTITKAPLTVTATSVSKVYNASLPALTFTINGFVNGETQAVLSGSPAESTSATAVSPVGTYPITISQGTLAAANYTFGPFADGTLTVTKATATLGLSNLTQTADGSPKPVTVTTNPAGLTVVSVTYAGISGTTYGPSTTAPSAVGSYSVVASLNNANYQATDATGTLNINAKPTPVITWANPANITYGTSLSGTQLNATATDPVTTATIPGTFVYTPANGVLNAGSQTLSVTFTPTDANTYNTATKSVTINVLKAPLTITADPQTKEYGSADPALTFSNSGLVNGDTGAVIGGTPGRLAGENAGTYAIQQGTLSAANYTISFTGANLTISAKPLTITADAKNKVYGAADPVLTYTQSGLVAGDSISGALVRVTGENAGTYAINQGSLSAGSNYTISFSGANLTIDKAALTIIANTQTKIYGAADPTFSYTQSGLVGGDSISGLLGRAAGENVGTYAIQLGTLSAGNNYTINFTSANLTITPKALTATGITAANKSYDGTATANLNFGGASLTGVVGGDTVGLDTGSATGAFSDKNVGNGKTVTLSGLGLNNNGAGNYTLQTPVTTTANITAAPLTVAVDTQAKVYGTTDPALTYQINGGALFAGDSISGSLSRAAGENVGSYAILQGTLSAGGNYAITYAGANLTISAKPLTITADAKSKAYGAADPAFTYTQTGLVAGDSISGALNRVAGENVGGYAIQQGTLSAGSNYTISFNDANLTIDKAALTITANAQTKVYGAADPSFSYTQSGLVGGDSISGALNRVAGENVGSYAIQQGNLSAGNNYTISFTSADLTITTKALTAIGITAANKSYDGSVTATLNFGGASLTGVVGGDTVSLNTISATGAFGDKNVGNGKTVTLSGLSINNNGAGNYTLQAPVTTTASITAAPLTVTADTQAKVYGAADPALTYQITVGTLFAGDSIGGSLSRAAGENVGSYAIQQGTLSAGSNYTLSFSGANLTIAAKSLTVTADPKSKVFGSVDPAFTYSQAGLVAGDSISGALNRAAGENVGSYAIQQGTLNAGSNYTISFSGANLTITKATPVITWSNPANIQVGTALGGTQLNATASVAGSFAYNPAAGTLLSAGTGQSLQVSFTPSDTANYNNATRTVAINVAPVLAGSGMLPTDQATDVSLYAKANLVFNNDMDASSLTTSTFTLSSSAGAVPGTVSYDAASRTATFTPDVALDSSTTYTATVTTDVRDSFGFPLASSKVWSFTTDGYGNIDTTSNNGTGHRVDIADALKYLHVAVGFAGQPANMTKLLLAPVINGVPTPDPNRHTINVQDVIAILERVVGLW